jgi:autotransporter-associated beta strand protein
LSAVPHGATYSVGPQGGTQSSVNTTAYSDLSLSLIGPNGLTTIQSADVNGIGLGETILRDLDPGTYYARVKGAQNDIQLYGISVSATASGSDNLNWIGSASSSWDVNSTANFDNGVSSDVFRTGDNVTFGAAGHIHNVFIQSNVSPASITANAGTYTLGGSGHIVAGSLTVLGGADMTLANSGNSYSGPTTVTNGALRITGDANAMVSPIAIAAGGTVFLNPTDAANMASTIDVQAGGVLEVNSSRQLPAKLTLSGDGGGNGALRIGAGAQPTFSGNVAIPASATISIASDAMATFSGSVAGSSASILTMDVQSGGQAQFTADVSMGAGGMVKSGGGAATLLGDYASTGITHVEGGTLEAGSSGQLGGEFRVDAGAQLLVAQGAVFTNTATLSGGGTVVGDFSFPGVLRPGDNFARLTIAGNLSLTAESHVALELGGLEPAAQYDQLQITANAALDGTLEVLLTNGFAPTAGNSFALITDSQITQQFANVVLPQLSAGLIWDLTYLANEVQLSVSAVPILLPADFNVDGQVDAADLAVLQANFGLASGTHADGDANGDGIIDGADFLTWQSELTASAIAVTTETVPEPPGWLHGMIAMTALAALLDFHRQRARA